MFENTTLVARLGGNPEMRYSPDGKAVTNFNVATNRQYTNNNGEKIKNTTWWRVSVFGKHAEACNTYLQKGSLVLIEGRMNADKQTGKPRIWQKKDNTFTADYEIIASTVRFLSSRSEQSQPAQAQQAQNSAMMLLTEDEIPF